MSDLPERVEHSILTRNLLKRGQSVLVAVSGGVDSMVLLDVLHELSRKYSWRLTIAHLNHQLRGRSSDADERLVVRTARRLGLDCVTERTDVRKFARAHGVSIEMAARQLRHEFLARTAARLRIPVAALAHHADDQVELFFLRLLRGSGNEGLAGMKWIAPSPASVGDFFPDKSKRRRAAGRLKAKLQLRIIRPLLDLPKAALREYAVRHKIAFREDASNASLDFLRNRIRNELLPLLRRKYQPALDRTVLRTIELAAGEAEFARDAAAEWLQSKSRAAFDKLSMALQRRVLQLQLLAQSIAPDYDLVERLRTEPERLTAISPRRSVLRDAAGRLHLRETKPASAFHPTETRRAVQVQLQTASRVGKIVFDSAEIRWRVRSGKSFKPARRRAGLEQFDADKVGSRIVLRHWRAGDRFQPIGMFSAVKLQDLFTNQKIPRERRHELVVATTQDGELFWVEKLRIGDRFKLSKETIHCLQWQWKSL